MLHLHCTYIYYKLKQVRFKKTYIYIYMTDECIELKNIKYKTMLVSPETMEVKSKQNIKNIDEIIKKDQAITDKLPWNKLNKTIKLNKLDNYIEEYSISNNINIDEREQLTTLLYDSLNKTLKKGR